MKTTLTLKTERLAELTTDDLCRVNGAVAQQSLIECLVVARTLRGCTTAIYCP